jgi:hypothetical protein
MNSGVLLASIAVLPWALALPVILAPPAFPLRAQPQPAKPERRIACDETSPKLVRVPLGLVTILSFPASPKEVVPGEAGFEFKTIRQDLIVKARAPGAKTNLFVYLEGRRCFFHLAAGPTGDEILLVRDAKDLSLEVKYVEKQ